MTESDSPVADTSMEQPTVEGTRPEGGGIGSNSYAGGNKRDPVESSPTAGDTIAGRHVSTATQGGNAGVDLGDVRTKSSTNNAATTERDRPGGGVTGISGKDESSAHDVPDLNPKSTHRGEDSRA